MSAEHLDHQVNESVTLRPGKAGKLARLGFILIAVGAVLILLALATVSGRERFGFAYLWGFTFLWAIVVGSLFFVALQHLVGAVWSVVLRRVGEILAAPMWIVALLFIPVLFFCLYGSHPIFPWAHAGAEETAHLSEGKQIYLQSSYFTMRAILFFVIWVFFSRYFIRASLRQDRQGPETRGFLTMRRISAPFLPFFAATVTLAGFDWLMSLELHWFSNMFPVYIFAGIVVSSLSAITLTVIWLRSAGGLGDGIVTNQHLYSLGGLIFAFSCFWAYIAFSQFMLIWYGNLPEETIYYLHRFEPGWLGLTLLVFAVRFALPFVLLLNRKAKMKPRRLVLVSILVLIGQFIDLYWLIMPEAHRASSAPGWQEIGPPLFMIGILMVYISQFIKKNGTLAVGDPLYEKSKQFYLEH